MENHELYHNSTFNSIITVFFCFVFFGGGAVNEWEIRTKPKFATFFEVSELLRVLDPLVTIIIMLLDI